MQEMIGSAASELEVTKFGDVRLVDMTASTPWLKRIELRACLLSLSIDLSLSTDRDLGLTSST